LPRKCIAAAMAAILICLCLFAAAAGGPEDPVVTLSYMTAVFKPSITQAANKRIDAAMETLSARVTQVLGADGSPLSGVYARQLLGGTGFTLEYRNGCRMEAVTLTKGSAILAYAGSELTILSGSTRTVAADGSSLLHLTNGIALSDNTLVAAPALLASLDGNAGVLVTSNAATFVLSGDFAIYGSYTTPVSPSGAYQPQYTRYANALNAMQLFLGTSSGYELDRPATRVEALVMLIRLLGEESAAKAYTGQLPFTDVPAWAKSYVAYAYHMGYTNGISATKFGSSDAVTPAMYVTFLLRALGYDDAAGDFYWSTSADFAQSIGMISAIEAHAIAQTFYRDQMVMVSYHALYTNIKGDSRFLVQRLIAQGAVTANQVNTASAIVG